MPTSPTARRRRLGIELRRLREAADVNGADVAATLGWSGTKVSRIETGRVSVHHGDVADLLDFYEVTDPVFRQDLITLARESKQKGWWHRHRGALKSGFDSYIGLETDACAISTYEAQVIPGLLQTAEYAHAIIEADVVKQDEAEIQGKINVRLARQKLLTRDDPIQLNAIIDEAILRREVGGSVVMSSQLATLISWGKLPNVRIQVLPFPGAHAAMDGPFIILQFPNQADPDLVYLEQATSGLVLEDSDDLHRYTSSFATLTKQALPPTESAALISSMI